MAITYQESREKRGAQQSQTHTHTHTHTQTRVLEIEEATTLCFLLPENSKNIIQGGYTNTLLHGVYTSGQDVDTLKSR